MRKSKKSNETLSKKNSSKESFSLKSSFYDYSDINAQQDRITNFDMDEYELKKRRRSDWIFLIIGIPAFIAIMYLIILITKTS